MEYSILIKTVCERVKKLGELMFLFLVWNFMVFTNTHMKMYIK